MRELTAHETRAIKRHAKLLRRLEVPDPVIFEVGANEGSTASAYLDEIPQGTVWAFEPNKKLLESINRNSCDRLHVIPAAVGSSEGKADLILRADNTVSSILEVEPELALRSRNYDTIEAVEVVVKTIDSLVEGKSGLPTPTLLCTDTQGYDLEVLRGARDTLATGEILLVRTEMYFASAFLGQPGAHEIMGFLAQFGYRLYGFDRLVEASSGALYFGSAIFLSPKAWQALDLL